MDAIFGMITDILIKVVLPAVSLFALNSARVYANKMAEKNDIEMSAIEQQALESGAKRAVAYAEEWAVQKIRKRVPEGQEKMTEALSFMKSTIKNVTTDTANKYIESALGSIVGVGASKDRAVR